jgi:hypothetical protein
MLRRLDSSTPQQSTISSARHSLLELNDRSSDQLLPVSTHAQNANNRISTAKSSDVEVVTSSTKTQGVGSIATPEATSAPVVVTSRGVGYRLGRRKLLSERRKRLADYSLVFAMFGLTAMIVETELSTAHVYDKVSHYVHV